MHPGGAPSLRDRLSYPCGCEVIYAAGGTGGLGGGVEDAGPDHALPPDSGAHLRPPLRGDLPPGRGNTPFADYLAAIRELGFRGTASLELEFPPDPSAMMAWVEEAFGTTRALLREAGVHA